MLRKRLIGRAAFTLIEVMVVTTIMTSQANNYGDVKRIAYQTSCRNNLQQLWQAFLMYDQTNGGLPQAVFYSKNAKGDPKSLYKVLEPAYQPMLVCPVFPSAIKDTGLTYIYNDTVAGQSPDMIDDPARTWLMAEMNAVSPDIRMPHPGGFHILYADGHIQVTKQVPPEFIEIQKKAAEQKNKAGAGAGDKGGNKGDGQSGDRPSGGKGGEGGQRGRGGANRGGNSGDSGQGAANGGSEQGNARSALNQAKGLAGAAAGE